MGFAGETERQLPSAEQRRHSLLQEEQRPRGKPNNTLLGPLGLKSHTEDRVRRTHSAYAECAGLSRTQPFQEARPTNDFIVHTPPAHPWRLDEN